ncbi:MAG: DUF2169 domain-containing protein [Polyangiaceae bacterium]
MADPALPTTDSPEPPPRRSAAIPAVTRSPFLAFTLPWQRDAGRDVRAVIVKGTFDLVPGGPATLRREGDVPSGDVQSSDHPESTLLYPSDFAIFKPRADVLLVGHAYAPRAGATIAEVGFRFGPKSGASARKGFARRLAVFGDRRWQRALVRVSPGAPSAFKSIPMLYENAYGGPGHARNPVGLGRADDRLPNLELVDEIIGSPDDAPDPACFAGVPPSWFARRARLGTYDAAWQSARWPYFPADFDWSYFQSAPASQQLESIAGDEAFEIVGMHPTLPVLGGSLGGVAPRCFAQRSRAGGGAFQEILLRIDTVVFDPDAMKINVVWRGLLDVRDDDASCVAGLFVLQHDLAAEPLGLEAARALHRAELAPVPPIVDDPDEPDAPRETILSLEEARLRARLDAGGIPKASGAPIAEPAPPPPTETAAPADHAHPRRVDLLRRLRENEPLASLDLSGLDLADVDFSGRSLTGANLIGARLCRARFLGSALTGANLGGADLTDAVLEGADLSGADLTAVLLEGASLDRAKLGLTVLEGARGARASFRGAEGLRASFAGGAWTGARFDGAKLPFADFTAANLDGAVLDGATLPDVRLYGARGPRASLRRCDLKGARADEAFFPEGAFDEADATRSIWDSAGLEGASFRQAKLEAASFCRASCDDAIFTSADLRAGRLARTKLRRAEMQKANLMEALLESADLDGADLRGANLHGAETWKANVRGAKLELAILTQCKLGGAT